MALAPMTNTKQHEIGVGRPTQMEAQDQDLHIFQLHFFTSFSAYVRIAAHC